MHARHAFNSQNCLFLHHCQGWIFFGSLSVFVWSGRTWQAIVASVAGRFVLVVATWWFLIGRATAWRYTRCFVLCRFFEWLQQRCSLWTTKLFGAATIFATVTGRRSTYRTTLVRATFESTHCCSYYAGKCWRIEACQYAVVVRWAQFRLLRRGVVSVPAILNSRQCDVGMIVCQTFDRMYEWLVFQKRISYVKRWVDEMTSN